MYLVTQLYILVIYSKKSLKMPKKKKHELKFSGQIIKIHLFSSRGKTKKV